MSQCQPACLAQQNRLQLERVEEVVLLRQRMLPMAREARPEQPHHLVLALLPTEALVAVVELQQLEQVGLEFCRAIMVLLLPPVVALEGLECRPQSRHRRNREAHLAHLEEGLPLLTLRLLELLVAGG